MEVVMEVNSDRLNAFMGKMITEVGAAMNASLVLLGDKLGLYRALAAKGPMNSAELASATGTNERYVREWLASQAASGYVEYDTASGKFSMLPEQAANWSYPQPEMSMEEIAFTLCTGLAGRLYLSGHLDRMDGAQRGLVAEGVAAYKQTRAHLAASTPFWPIGMPDWEDGWVVLGLDAGEVAHLVVWRRPWADESVRLPLLRYAGVPLAINTAYPRSLDPWEMRWTADQGVLEICRTPSPPTARVLRLTLGSPGKDLPS